MQPRYAIVVAGGQGLRMGTDIPKQFLPLGARPVLMHTLELFTGCEQITLALPEGQIDYWRELCQKYGFGLKHQICPGGETRFHSVRNALETLQGKWGCVAVHDGVRPFVSQSVIEACFIEAERSGAALPYIPVTDSLRHLAGTSSTAVPRNEFVAVQTPQVFDLERLATAYRQEFSASFTDDASVYEAAGLGEIGLVKGNVENIKITSPQDLATAEYILSKKL
ncbi:MAG: 2-C-methyl-D-erythritol 4-phosphate cytidylyltransferase [Porphyromonadaceae bacterium]|nr:2-C-methyl-D-erythritol 4-phosphate cytidylyltransferase [Porphyromonadaceae bacterium]